jgi:hypothetical protein
MLAASQAKHSQQLALQLQREDKELEQKIAIRRNQLEQKVRRVLLTCAHLCCGNLKFPRGNFYFKGG